MPFTVLTTHLIPLAIVVTVISATVITLVIFRYKISFAVGIGLGISTRAPFIHNLVRSLSLSMVIRHYIFHFTNYANKEYKTLCET